MFAFFSLNFPTTGNRTIDFARKRKKAAVFCEILGKKYLQSKGFFRCHFTSTNKHERSENKLKNAFSHFDRREPKLFLLGDVTKQKVSFYAFRKKQHLSMECSSIILSIVNLTLHCKIYVITILFDFGGFK
jgi:hypothetical protein